MAISIFPRLTSRLRGGGIAATLGVGFLILGSAHAQDATTNAASAFSTLPSVRDDQIGVCTHFALKNESWPVEKMVPLIAQSGVGWIRDDLEWKNVEKAKGVYEIPPETMNWINAVSAAGIKIDIVFNYSNAIYPDRYDPDAYAAAAAWTAKTLAGKVQAIEILNEPENFGFSKYYDKEQAWSGLKKDGSVATYISKYVALLNPAAKAIREANPDIKILGLGMAPPANFRALAMGIGPEVDGITDHPYSNRTAPELVPFAASDGIMKRDGVFTADEKGSFASQIKMYQAQSAQYHGPKEIWLTEQGWATFQESKAGGLFAGFTESAQAKYLLRRLSESLGLGVSAAFIYDLRDDGTDPYYQECHFGLLDHNSNPKLSYGAVRRFSVAMADFRPKNNFEVETFPVSSRADTHPINWDGGKLESNGSVKAYQFADSKGTPLIALWTAERADGDFAPLLGDVEITTDKTVSKITAYDPLTDATQDIPFAVKPGRVVMQKITISDSPVLLTVTTDSLQQAAVNQ